MEQVLQRYSWALMAVAVLLAAFLVARTVNTLAAQAIAPKPALVQQAGAAAPQPGALAQHVDLDQDRLAKLLDVPLPKPLTGPEAGAVPEPVAKPSWSPTPVRSALHGTLVGTAIADPPRYSLCQITNPDVNETQVYSIGDKYQGARVYQVEKERVLIDNDGRNEYIDNNAAAAPNLGVTPMPGPVAAAGGDDGVKQLSENQYVVAKAEINNALTNLSDLATKARIVPSFKNGVANGFKLFSIVPDSLYSKIGVQNGDVIRKINGYEMNSPDKALEIYQKLRDANRIEIELERRGDTVRKSYSIE